MRPRVKITPREKGELAFRSLYYPWGKKETTRSPDRERSSFFNINFVIATRGERKSEIMQISRKADLNLIRGWLWQGLTGSTFEYYIH